MTDSKPQISKRWRVVYSSKGSNEFRVAFIDAMTAEDAKSDLSLRNFVIDSVNEDTRDPVDETAAAMADRMMDFYRCPTTGRVIDAIPGDDKVLCDCGQSNPKCPTEATERTGTHVARFLTKADGKAFLAERARKGAAS